MDAGEKVVVGAGFTKVVEISLATLGVLTEEFTLRECRVRVGMRLEEDGGVKVAIEDSVVTCVFETGVKGEEATGADCG